MHFEMKLLTEFLCLLAVLLSTVESAEKRKAFCYLPYEFGKCGGHRVMWAFSIKELECVPFVFSNCGGNENRFHTKENCEKACAPIQSRFVLAN
ncbi:kunitz-type serine protease inhibitor microlepidin-3 [Drosophila mauritiana]|uniref:Kunitz-type serine protease inhibitor microlepidin-3 n=1 Tax=Drosophila mauritiana TaxID=7226 RepID=A0A6P8KNM9_DROMA|nr:kunitz-type serine protease inhibitor microlepidin-3 [Drosophila mauritiana]